MIPHVPPEERVANLAAGRIGILYKRLAEWRENMAALLKHVGIEVECEKCGRPIVFVKHRDGRPTPYDYDGVNHFLTCAAIKRK